MPARKKTSLAAKARYQNQFREHSNNSDHLEIDLTVENDDYSTSSEETEIEIVAFDDLDDEAIPVMKEKLKNSWNEVGNNFYHQGLGTSRSSVKAREKKERDKLQEANKLRKITDFLRPPETITVELSDPDMDLLFAFDNSMTHHARPPDGLDAALITLGDGGKNTPAMKETWFINADGCRVTQRLQHAIQPGQPKAVCKGIKTILTERGLWTNDMNLTSARACLASQPDFLAQGEWLREAVEGSDHHIIFYPKYHCELNWIEMVWAHLKAHLRRHCTYSFKDLETKLPVAIADEITPCLAKKLQRYAFRFMSGYREGLEGPLLDYTMKRYKGHRCIPKGVMEQMKADYETHLSKKTKRS